MFLHNTIRKYTLALLDFFNEVEVQHKDSDGALITQKIPISYRNKEKNQLMDKTWLQQIQGNMNILPLGSLCLNSISKAQDRATSKYNRFTKLREDKTIEYMYNPVPYDFSFEVSYFCRGMNEACQIIEEICPKFNPNVAIDIYVSENQDEPSRIPVQLSDVSYEFLGFEEYSLNLIKVTFSINLSGWMFPPIKEYSKIKEFNINLLTPQRESELLHFDVIDGYPRTPPDILRDPNLDTRLYVKAYALTLENNILRVSYESNSKEKPEISFVSDDCEIIHKSKFESFCEIKNPKENFTVCAIVKIQNERSSILKTFKNS